MQTSIIKIFEQYFAKLNATPGDELFNSEMREMLALVEECVEADITNRAIKAAVYMCRRRARNGFCFQKGVRCDRVCDHIFHFRLHMQLYDKDIVFDEFTEKVNKANARIHEFILSGKFTHARVSKEDSAPCHGMWSERTK